MVSCKTKLNERTLDFIGPSKKTEYGGNNMHVLDSRVICYPTRLDIGIGTGPSGVAVGSRKQNKCGIIFMCSLYKKSEGVCEMRESNGPYL